MQLFVFFNHLEIGRFMEVQMPEEKFLTRIWSDDRTRSMKLN